MDDPDAQTSRGPELSNYNVLQENKGDDNGNDMNTRSPRLLTERDSCEHCNREKVQGESVCCMFCKGTFHALCTSLNKDGGSDYLSDNACTKSFFTNAISNRRFPTRARVKGLAVSFSCVILAGPTLNRKRRLM